MKNLVWFTKFRVVTAVLYTLEKTKRDLKPSLDEHKIAIKKQRPNLSALCEHSITKDHIISWTAAKILELEIDCRKRLSLKSWHINAKPHVMKQNDGNSFPVVYLDLLTQ